ncbi:hypothetical protein YPPY66_3845, partial [Yersinia pestis PY-66]
MIIYNSDIHFHPRFY